MSRGSLGLVGLSLGALCAAWACGVRYGASELGTSWQLLDPLLLKDDLFRSLWTLHAQPPLYNLAVGLALKLGNAPIVLTLFGAACAACIAVCTRALALEVGAGPRAAFVAGALVAISPATLLYAHYAGPDVATAAALSASAVYVARGKHRAGFALLGVACLLRSLLAPPVVILAWLAAGKRASKPAIAVLAALLVLSAKNALLVGSFGTSSWLGMNLARVTVMRIPYSERAALSPLAAVGPFAPLEDYPGALTASNTGVPALDQPRKSTGAVNYNHAAYARIGREMLRDDLRAAAAHPLAVAGGWAVSWMLFLRPSDEYGYLRENRQRIAGWSEIWDGLLCLRIPLPALVLGQTEIFLSLLIGLPLLFAFGVRGRRAGYAAALVAFVAVFGNSLELGENYRFRFLVAPLCASLAAAALARRATGS